MVPKRVLIGRYLLPCFGLVFITLIVTTSYLMYLSGRVIPAPRLERYQLLASVMYEEGVWYFVLCLSPLVSCLLLRWSITKSGSIPNRMARFIDPSLNGFNDLPALPRCVVAVVVLMCSLLTQQIALMVGYSALGLDTGRLKVLYDFWSISLLFGAPLFLVVFVAQDINAKRKRRREERCDGDVEPLWLLYRPAPHLESHRVFGIVRALVARCDDELEWGFGESLITRETASTLEISQFRYTLLVYEESAYLLWLWCKCLFEDYVKEPYWVDVRALLRRLLSLISGGPGRHDS